MASVRLREGDIVSAVVYDYERPTVVDDIKVRIGIYKINRNLSEIDCKEEAYNNWGLHQRIRIMTPENFYKRGMNLVMERRGGTYISGEGFAIEQFYANPEEEWVWENGKRMMKASAITDDLIDEFPKYKKTQDKELRRQELLKTSIEEWNNASNEEKINILEKNLLSKYCIFGRPLEHGLTFKAKVKQNVSKGKTYNEFLSHEWDHDLMDWRLYNKADMERTETTVAEKALADHFSEGLTVLSL